MHTNLESVLIVTVTQIETKKCCKMLRCIDKKHETVSSYTHT